jgi:hypothetical protein
MRPPEQLGHVHGGRGHGLALTREERQLAQGVGMASDQADEAVRVEDDH